MIFIIEELKNRIVFNNDYNVCIRKDLGMANLKLGPKFLLTIGVFLTLIMCVGLYWIIDQQNNLNSDSSESSAKMLSGLMKFSLDEMMAMGENEKIPAWLEKVRGLDGIKELRVIRGEMFEDKGEYLIKDEADKIVLATGKPVAIFDEKSSSFREVFPFVAENQCLDCHDVSEGAVLGAASISVRQDQIIQQVKSNSANMTIFIIFEILVILTVLYVIVRKMIVAPLSELTSAANKISEGQTEVFVAANREDEIGILGRAFNTMSDHIRSAMEGLNARQLEAEIARKEVEKSRSEIQSNQAYLQSEVEKLLKVTESVANGDLTIRIHSENADDIGQLVTSINQMVTDLHRVVDGVSEVTAQIKSASVQMAAGSEQMAAGARVQSAQTKEVASAVDAMSQTTVDNAFNTTKTVEVATNSGTIAKEGGVIVGQTIEKINQIASVVRNTSKTIEGLGVASTKIGEIIDVINEIADQTNLLALNAAIEAARAGDQGRGFAVVADEVRKLAERTTEATKKISGMITNIQTETRMAVEEMHQGNSEVNEGLGLAERAGAALEKIVNSTEAVVDMVTQIAAATEEQSVTGEEISRNVESISNVVSESAESVSQMAAAASDLDKLSEKLQKMVSQFKTEKNTQIESWMA